MKKNLILIFVGIALIAGLLSAFAIRTLSPSPNSEEESSRTLPSSGNSEATIDSSAQNTTDDCIITVEGTRYNVTQLRGNHPGGDIFVCVTDMTQLFRRQHGTSLRRLEPYKIQ